MRNLFGIASNFAHISVRGGLRLSLGLLFLAILSDFGGLMTSKGCQLLALRARQKSMN